MTIERLEQYCSMKKEIDEIRAKVDRLKSGEHEFVADTVRGSTEKNPSNRVIRIYGISIKKQDKINRLFAILSQREEKLVEELTEIEIFISSVADSEIRRIIDYYYLQNKSWNGTAIKVYGTPCGDRARKKIERFFKAT